jgi:hypothetical protein
LVRNKLPNRQIRLLGFLPLTFFLAQAIHYWDINELGNMLWMCNIGNLVLAIGMFLERPLLVRVAVMWMVPGLIVWCIYVVPTWATLLTGQFTWRELFAVLSSSLAHFGGITIGLVALWKIGMDKRVWIHAFGWYFIMQLFSRLLTPPSMNVNLAHRVQDGFEKSFNSYWKFWLLLTALVGIGCWLLAYVFHRIWLSRSNHLSADYADLQNRAR